MMASRPLKLFTFFVSLSFLLECDLSLPVVHVIPHSHCDAGYRESFEGYYDGQVRNIINTMLEALNSSSSRKFVWEETSFLSRWWSEATDDQKILMKKLTDEGRLEFIGGGWTMHDEAVNDAGTIIKQMTLGLKFLKENLNVRPKHEWHIDPFGHSLMMVELYDALQYEAIVLNRIPDPIKHEMKEKQGLEFEWKSSFTDARIFTHVLGMHYGSPAIIGLDTAEKATSLVNTSLERLKWQRTENLLLPFGGDFNFQNATQKFSGMEELIDYINQHQDDFKISIQFSTLKDYFSVVMKDTKVSYPTQTDGDFFPYIACYPCFSEHCGGVKGMVSPCGIQTPDAYWSGFYTSKPSQKLLTRVQEASALVLDELNALYPIFYNNMKEVIDTAHSTRALLTHHDAITGTSFPPAYDDYNTRLTDALNAQNEAIGIIKFSRLCAKRGGKKSFSPNTTQVLSSLNDSNLAVVAVFNPNGDTRSDYVRVELPSGLCVKVSNSSNNALQFQQSGSVLYVPMTLDPLEIRTIFLSKIQCPKRKTQVLKGASSVSNGFLELLFDDAGHLSSLKNTKTGESIGMTFNFNELLEKKASILEIPDSVCDGTNVYTFVPDEGSKSLLPKNKKITTVVTSSGPLLWEMNQEISTETCPIRMNLRLFKPLGEESFHQEYMEVQNIVGPLEEDYPNSVIFSVNTSLQADSRFTTYTSGLYSMNRAYNESMPVQANYFPLVGRVSMTEGKGKKALVVSTQRPMAVSGHDGTLNLLFHRRIKLINDPRGNDDSIMSDPIYLGVVSADDVNESSYDAMSRSQTRFTAYAMIENSPSDWNNMCVSHFHPVKQSLPKGVKLIGLEVLSIDSESGEYSVGIRLVNVGGVAAQFDLSDWFTELVVGSVTETTPDFGIVLSKQADTSLTLPSYKLVSVIVSVKSKTLYM